jgi:hypothetical protein
MATASSKRGEGVGEEEERIDEAEEGQQEPGVENAYVCGRCGSSFSTPQALRDHEETHVEDGDEEVQEEWEHRPGDPEEAVPSLGGDTTGDTV